MNTDFTDFTDFDGLLAQVKKELRAGAHMKKLEAALGVLRGGPAIIYGAGVIAHQIHDSLRGRGIDAEAFYVDPEFALPGGRDPITGKPVLTAAGLTDAHRGAAVIIGAGLLDSSKTGRLRAAGFTGRIITPEDSAFPLPAAVYESYSEEAMLRHVEKYADVWEMFGDAKSRAVLSARIRHTLLFEPMPCDAYHEQYFAPDVVGLSRDEVFVDGGFFDGYTFECFRARADGEFRQYYGFDANAANIQGYGNNEPERLQLVHMGLWSEPGAMGFREHETSAASGHLDFAAASGGGGGGRAADFSGRFFFRQAFPANFHQA